jgi:hypothetical protein
MEVRHMISPEENGYGHTDNQPPASGYDLSDTNLNGK